MTKTEIQNLTNEELMELQAAEDYVGPMTAERSARINLIFDEIDRRMIAGTL